MSDMYLDVSALCRALSHEAAYAHVPLGAHEIWRKYTESDDTRWYMNELALLTEIPVDSLIQEDDDGGVWLHRYCAYHFASHLLCTSLSARLMRLLNVQLDSEEYRLEKYRISRQSDLQMQILKMYFNHKESSPDDIRAVATNLRDLAGHIRQSLPENSAVDDSKGGAA